MAASTTVPEVSPPDNSTLDPLRPLTPSRGVITLCGYGISVRVERGHLCVEDGVGDERRRARFGRVGHNLRRLIVVGSDGVVSFSAIRWLADARAAFVMLDRDGTVLLTAGSAARSRDPRLRRAQATSHQSGVAVQLARDLVAQKLAGQEHVARELLKNPQCADAVATAAASLVDAATVPLIRTIEARAAVAYWEAWRGVSVEFPRKDLPRVPQHWRMFGSRHSPLTGSPRLAVSPPNAMLNYLYAMLETESRLAAHTIGLDAGLAFLHADTANRDSLACDLMEPVRPQVDAFVLKWIQREPLRRNWFFEDRNGNCRLMPDLIERLSETVTTWARAVAPITESIAHTLWTTAPKTTEWRSPATHLTQTNRRAVHGAVASETFSETAPRLCHGCGNPLARGRRECATCSTETSTQRLIGAAVQGRTVAQSERAQARRATTRARNARAQRQWIASSQPFWLTEAFYGREIIPRLNELSVAHIARAMAVSRSYAGDVRAGRVQPHPRHWLTLANLLSLSDGMDTNEARG